MPTASRKAAASPADAFLSTLHGFDAFGAATQVVTEGGLTYYVNEYWTAAQRSAHSLHEISYRACFKPQLPAFFIERLTAPGETVCDPFMGRGTTPLEAALMGRRVIGSDANPLSIMLTRPRLDPPELDAVAARLAEAPLAEGEIEREDLLAFYHPDTLRQICALRAWLLAREALADPLDSWIRMVALNRLTGHSPGFFSVYTMPPNQAVSVKAQLKINTRRSQTPPPRDVAALIMKKSRALLADVGRDASSSERAGKDASSPPANLAVASATHLTHVGNAEVDLVVTSPPFLDIVDYRGDNWLRNWFAGVDTDRLTISQLRSVDAWSGMTRAVFEELARVLRPGGHVAYEVGEVRGGGVLLERLVWQAMEGLPFERLGVMVNQQSFTKTSNCWGVANNNKGVNSNRIVLARRL
ncbi:DNA methyltransferase [Methylocystis echinoides]|uniref:Methyltransferase n=1 Tax=Methylocystis echinoides TaxID=29468 RepID=A0A9W6LSG4_9HYPH|nr:DNA methyltransferase [Methylocystis echinoides]GLI93472.1 DNA methylase [Methylocystis echinoides]